MNTQSNTDNNNKVVDKQSSDSTTTAQKVVTSGASPGKEKETVGIASKEIVEQISPEVEIPKEVERVGVTAIKETIELPPDVKKLGVSQSGVSSHAPAVTPLPQVSLPISDKKIIVGLHAQVFSSVRWLAVWCIRKLQKAHIALKIIHKKIVRVRN